MIDLFELFITLLFFVLDSYRTIEMNRVRECRVSFISDHVQ